MAFNFGAPSGTSGTSTATAAPADILSGGKGRWISEFEASLVYRVGLEDLEQQLQLQALPSAFQPQQTQAVQAFSVALRTKVLALVLVLAQRRELALV
uniref:Nucleoporin 54 n=1 Tax=Mus musculus TaxID=10090 RepID=D6RFN7_MOUSE